MRSVPGEDYLWTQKWRPHSVAETVLPANLKKTFQAFVDAGDIPNLILNGPAGVGKTTVAMAMIDEIGADYFKINGSLDGNIGTLRNDIVDYVTTVSLTGGRKYVILDEADFISGPTQVSLRNFMEEHSMNAGFILTCNHKNKIIRELHSRCAVIDFSFDKSEAQTIAAGFFKRILTILDTEGVEYDKRVVAEVIQRYFPDCRRTIGELQRYAIASGKKIDSGALGVVTNRKYEDLVAAMKAKDFTTVRRWVTESMGSSADMFNDLYEGCRDYFVSNSIPTAVLIIAKYAYQSSFVVNQEINSAACLLELMVECQFQ